MFGLVDSLERTERKIDKWTPRRSSSKQTTRHRPPAGWEERLRALFPFHFAYEFSQPHREMGEWAGGIDQAGTPRPFVALWPRGRGKSTWAEALAADLGARGARLYCMYVSETQDQADKHVATIGRMLESERVARYFPAVGQPKLGKNGSRTWNREVMQAANDFTVESIGLDKAVRGQKIDWVRPDLIIFDDIDNKQDTDAATTKKQDTITTSILPAGAANCAVLFVQNIIRKDSIAYRLSRRPGTDGAADYLADRIVSGPHPAVEGLDYEYQQLEDGLIKWVITAGRSLWEGFTLSVCQAEINREGPAAFELESQHDVDADNPLALLAGAILDATRVSSHPDLFRVGVGVDPSGGAGQVGIVGGGVARIGRVVHGYTIADYSTPAGTPAADWAVAVLRCYHAIGADFVAVEKNFGGDMVANTIRTAELRDVNGDLILSGRNVPIIEVVASRGKEVRAEPVASLFQTGRFHHVGRFVELERQWTHWLPGTKPSPDRLDAEVWLATELIPLGGGGELPAAQPEQPSKWAKMGDTVEDGSRWKRY